MAISDTPHPLTLRQRAFKRLFDITLSFIGLACTAWLILLTAFMATFDTRACGFFVQERIGMNGRPFPLVKIRTMRTDTEPTSSVTRHYDPRITGFGRLLRRFKIDELPQLFNVLVGHMSIVGPRPDVSGFADRLGGTDRVILAVRPGLTGPASVHFSDEERLLSSCADPETFNTDVLWPLKVQINKRYVTNYSFLTDLHCILRTVTAVLGRVSTKS